MLVEIYSEIVRQSSGVLVYNLRHRNEAYSWGGLELQELRLLKKVRVLSG